MNALSPLLKRIFFQVVLLLLCYFLCRTAFTVINISRFSGLTLTEFFRLSFHALRYDISTIAALNVLYFILLLLPLPIWRMPRWEGFTQWLFITVNTLAFCFEISDWAYFPFTSKRATHDVLDMISRSSDFLSLLPHFVVAYWYAPLGVALLIFLLWRCNTFIRNHTALNNLRGVQMKWTTALWHSATVLVIAGLSVIAVRGGLQLIPVGNGNALQVAENKFVPIVLNTPFSIMHSYSGKIEEVNFYAEEELPKFFNPVKHYPNGPMQRKNVVVIMLESFSKEYTGLGGRKSFTPFLDSLMQHSLVCTNAFANALHSAVGVPAIISGLPSLMNEPFTTSSYGTNKLTSLPELLKQKGYETVFLHGGTNGTMSFDIYAANAGFDTYLGRTEYNNEADYDGNWGIWDEPFLQYTAKKLSGLREPFMASVFTLSSHDPFAVPEKYKSILPSGELPVQQTIAYTDYSLRKFFETASQQSWFQNTLFVLTADHAAPGSNDPYYASLNMGAYAIPVLFFDPGNPAFARSSDSIFQHIDILPSVLDYLHYEEPFFAFGNSIFRPAYPRFVVNELSGKYQWYMNDYLLTANGLEAQGLYHFKTDSLCQHNLFQQQTELAQTQFIPYFKAFVQLYRQAVIRNKLSL